VAWSRAPLGGEGRWTLLRNDSGFAFSMRDDTRGTAFQLATRERGRPVLQGPNGFSAKGTGPTQASLYYSFTRLATSGTLTIGGTEYRVSGTTWMDKEFGSNQLARSQVGWDWFSIQLDDGRELMLYQLRDSSGATDWASGTLVREGGEPRYREGAVRISDGRGRALGRGYVELVGYGRGLRPAF
jgi:predicted secreted hydrolase